jgi:tetratricopeptide (TPR) repeat protein
MKSATSRLLGLILLSLALLPGGCHRPTAEKPVISAQASAEATLIMLSEAKAWQRRADLHLSEGDVTSAVSAIKEVLSIQFPADAAEAEDVRLDACARLAKLYLSQSGTPGQPGQNEQAEAAENRALEQIETGRKLASHDSFFRAHLEMIAADVYEARGNRMTDAEARKAEKRKAIEALDRAIQIDRRVQRALLNLPVEPAGERR